MNLHTTHDKTPTDLFYFVLLLISCNRNQQKWCFLRPSGLTRFYTSRNQCCLYTFKLCSKAISDSPATTFIFTRRKRSLVSIVRCLKHISSVICFLLFIALYAARYYNFWFYAWKCSYNSYNHVSKLICTVFHRSRYHFIYLLIVGIIIFFSVWLVSHCTFLALAGDFFHLYCLINKNRY